MTVTDASFVTVVGEAAASLLPADHGWSIGEPPEDLAPSGATVAVQADAGDHVIAVICTSEMARRIQVGPPPADGLLDGLEPTLGAIATVLGVGPVTSPVTIDSASLVAGLEGDIVATALVDGEDHLVTVIVVPPRPEAGAETPAATFEPIVAPAGAAGAASGLEVLHDVQMAVTAELGRTRMPLRDILLLAPGSVIELDRAASAPVDVMVNGTLIARGEVVVVDEEFGIRINEIIGYEPPRTGRGEHETAS